MYINYFRFDKGEQCEIDTIPLIKEDDMLSRLFYEDGFRYFLKSNQDILEMAESLLRGYLAEIPVNIDEIENVLFISDNNDIPNLQDFYHNRFVAFRNGLFDVLSKCGLNKAFPHIIGGAGCAGLSVAIKLAQNLTGGKEDKYVLAIFIDKFENDNKRIMPLVRTNRLAAGSIGSDVAAALLFSGRPEGAFSVRINRQFEAAHLKMITSYEEMLKSGSQGEYVLETVKGLINFKRASEEKLPKKIGSYQNIFTGNYTRSYFKIYNLQFGWNIELVNMGSKAAIGHAQSLDALYEIFQSGKEVDGAVIFLIGPCMWSATDITCIIN